MRRMLLLVVWVTLTTGVASAAAETRYATQWPFAATSPWNTAIGSGAQYANSACTADVQANAGGMPWINASTWSIPIYQTSSIDPFLTVIAGGQQWSVKVHTPVTAQPSPDADHHLALIEPGALSEDEFDGASIAQPLWIFSYTAAQFDLYGDGITATSGAGWVHSARASGVSAFGGLIRISDLFSGSIRHALALEIPESQLEPGPVWPASSDGPNTSGYTGHVPMGTLVAIPSTVNVASLGLSPVGTMIALAMQKYGAYVVDTSGSFDLDAEPGADSLVAPARGADMTKIRSLVQCVSNNGPSSVGGGGTPLAPPPPPFA